MERKLKGRNALDEHVVKHRIEEALGEVERALESLNELTARLDRGNFSETHHDAARQHLQAALAHLESIRFVPNTATRGGQS